MNVGNGIQTTPIFDLMDVVLGALTIEATAPNFSLGL